MKISESNGETATLVNAIKAILYTLKAVEKLLHISFIQTILILSVSSSLIGQYSSERLYPLRCMDHTMFD